MIHKKHLTSRNYYEQTFSERHRNVCIYYNNKTHIDWIESATPIMLFRILEERLRFMLSTPVYMCSIFFAPLDYFPKQNSLYDSQL